MNTIKQPNEVLKSLIATAEHRNDYMYCPHHKFKTSQTFVEHSTKRVDELSVNFDNILPDITIEWYECCEECYSRIFIYIYINFLDGPLPVLYHDISTNIMNFRAISDLIFNQSDMFIKIFYYTFACNRLQTITVNEIEKNNGTYYLIGISM
eukprot:495544_1